MRQQVVLVAVWSECVVREKFGGGGNPEIKENWAANGQANLFPSQRMEDFFFIERGPKS
jgi:hypothetical protein